MKRLFVIFLMALLPAYTRTALAYEVKTHRELSERALVGSALATNDSVLLSLGLAPLVDDQTFPNSKPEDDRTISQLLQDGSAFEDDGTRSRAHFFNPLNGNALFNMPGFIPSPDWTLEDKGDISDQEDSFEAGKPVGVGATGRSPLHTMTASMYESSVVRFSRPARRGQEPHGAPEET